MFIIGEFVVFYLLSTENWEYRLKDIIYIFKENLISKDIKESIYIEGIGDCIPIRSARVGIILALKSLNLPKGAHIGVPLYCCPVVFKSIKSAGYQPYFIDIDYLTYCISPEDLYKKRKEIDAVIVVHMFGNICDMNSILQFSNNIPIIEDCAQSLGSKLNGNLAGLFGIISIFSFRSGKTISVGEGGALYTSDLNLKVNLYNLLENLSIPQSIEEYLHIIKTYIRSKLRGKLLWGIVGHPIWKVYNKTFEYPLKSPINMSQIFKTDLSLIKERLKLLDFIIQKNRYNANYLIENLEVDPKMLCLEKKNTFYNRYFFPILFNSSNQRDIMASFLFKKGIDTSMPYKDVVEIARNYYGYKGDCPVAEEIAKRILVIPSNYKIKMEELKYIVKCINLGWMRIVGQN